MRLRLKVSVMCAYNVECVCNGVNLEIENKHLEASDKWVPVTMAWRVLRLQMEERPPIWRVAANILNKQSQPANQGWSSSLVVG
jgi:hypothetical protein